MFSKVDKDSGGFCSVFFNSRVNSMTKQFIQKRERVTSQQQKHMRRDNSTRAVEGSVTGRVGGSSIACYTISRRLIPDLLVESAELRFNYRGLRRVVATLPLDTTPAGLIPKYWTPQIFGLYICKEPPAPPPPPTYPSTVWDWRSTL